MNQEKLPSWARLAWRSLTRRGFIQSAAGAGAGFMLGSKFGVPAWADEAAHPAYPAVPRPIPHITGPLLLPGSGRRESDWGTPYPVGSGKVDIAGGTAELLVHNVCSVFDVFTVPNSFDPAHALGIFNAIIHSMRIEWSGVTRSVLGFSDSVLHELKSSKGKHWETLFRRG